MKAVVIHRTGGPEVLQVEDVPTPAPGPTEALVRVKACGLNHLDIWTRTATRRSPILPAILGCDVAGVVDEVGGAVENVKRGSEVIALPGVSCGACVRCLSGNDHLCPHYAIIGAGRLPGGYAQYVSVPAVNLVPKPANLTFEEAATMGVVLLTAWHILVARAAVKPSDVVLVQSAASGAGIAAIQIAKLFGAQVVATASTAKKLAAAKKAGADHLINSAEKDFVAEVGRITSGRGVDIVLDSNGGDIFERSLKCLAVEGTLVNFGATVASACTLDTAAMYSRNLNVLGARMGPKQDFLAALPFIQQGKLRSIIHSVLPLEQAADAHRLLEQRKAIGKVVLHVG
ncbi:MAG: zinc-binding dehydrogenase [Chloroflexi bacterium]|nr:zinc-binding dehydrogenase [Chloroflexota bacterium]